MRARWYLWRFLATIAVLALPAARVPHVGAAVTPAIVLDPPAGPNGTLVTIAGTGAPPGAVISLSHAEYTDAECNGRATGGAVGSTMADGAGRFAFTYRAAEDPRVATIAFHVFGSGAPTPPGACSTFTGGVMFPATGKTANGAFLRYWRAHGDLAQQGYPISDEFTETSLTDGKAYTVQYFERARFEYHPENAPPYDVLLGLTGAEQYRAKYPQGHPPRTSCTADEDHYYPELHRCVSAVFDTYWRNHGGLVQQGLPLSPALGEVSPIDGKEYTVQYFERARFEYHPEIVDQNRGVSSPVLLGLLGREQFLARYPHGSPDGPQVALP